MDIEESPDGRVIARFPYSRERVRRVRALPGRRWHPEGRYWSVPASQRPALEAALRDADLETTTIDTHVLNRGGRGVVSPSDRLGLD